METSALIFFFAREPDIKIFMLGDVVGKPGRDIVKNKLKQFVSERDIDFVIANGENAADGSGINPPHVAELTKAGVDAITTGDHIWKRAQVVEYIKNPAAPLLRPLNYPKDAAGRGYGIFPARSGRLVGVINVIGRVYLGPADCPFEAALKAAEDISRKTKIIIVDIHAEATSEKIALGYFLDGKVTAVIGTHTHVQTADERILPGGTACLTDTGMTGPHKSVIGRQIDKVLHKFTTGMYAPFEVATDDVKMCGVLITLDATSGKATAIERVVINE